MCDLPRPWVLAFVTGNVFEKLTHSSVLISGNIFIDAYSCHFKHLIGFSNMLQVEINMWNSTKSNITQWLSCAGALYLQILSIFFVNQGLNLNSVLTCYSIEEYSAAFSTRPRIPRTPDTGTRPTSRGSLSDGPPPPLKYSDSLPTSRPNSGGRPSSGEYDRRYWNLGSGLGWGRMHPEYSQASILKFFT